METAKLISKDLKISTKQSVEICDFIRNKNLLKAQEMLEKVLSKKIAVPFNRFNRDLGHKHGIGPGSYPEKTTQEILNLLKGIQANAENQGMDSKNLYIVKLVANRGPGQWHFGRFRRRQMKNTSIEIEVSEIQKEKKETKKKETKK